MDRQKKEKREKEDRNFKAFQDMVREAREQHLRKKNATLTAANHAGIGNIPEVNPFSGEKILKRDDPAVLRAHRESMWATAVGGRQPWEASSGDLPVYPDVWSYQGYRASKEILNQRELQLNQLEKDNIDTKARNIDCNGEFKCDIF